MTYAIDPLARLGRASLDGAVYVGAVHLLCLALPRLPAASRCALYWLACARLLLGLFWIAPLELPLLPTAAPVARLVQALPVTTTLAPAPVAHMVVAHTLPVWPAVLISLLFAGGSLQLARAALQLWRTRAMLRRAKPVTHGLTMELLETLSQHMGVRTPRLLESLEVAGPLLAGFVRPAVVLPAASVVALSPTELRLSLLHELQHLRRRDLWLGLLPAVTRMVFFFHPLARLAAREHALAREAACDAAVVQAGASPHEYGQLLVRIGVVRTSGLASAASAAATIEGLKRRLVMLQATTRARPALTWLLFGFCGLLLVPMRLVARPSQAAAATGEEELAMSREHDAEARAEAAEARADEAQARAEEAQARAQEAHDRAEVERERKEAEQERQQGERERRQAEQERQQDLRARDIERAHQHADRDRDAQVKDVDSSRRLARTHDEDPRESLHGDAFVLVEKHDSVSMHGTRRDLAAAQGQDLRTPFLWFRKAGVAYVVTDSTTVAKALSLFAPQRELGKKQSELGAQQAALGKKQADLGAKQAELGNQQARLASRQARSALRNSLARATDGDEGDGENIDHRMDELGAMQQRLSDQQRALGEQQRPLGEEQGRLGQEQGRLGQEAAAQMRELMDASVANGQARPAR